MTGEPGLDWSDPELWERPEVQKAVPVIGARPSGSFPTNSVWGPGDHGQSALGTLPDASRVDGSGPKPFALAASMRNGSLNRIAPTIMTRANSLNSNPCVVLMRDGRPAAHRFTPKECLRLQGIDDDWLDGLTLCGKPLSDTERYRLAGNAWPVPVAAWILERLMARARSCPDR